MENISSMQSTTQTSKTATGDYRLPCPERNLGHAG